jgi:TatD DNase family protein
LDYYKGFSRPDHQKALFLAHLDAAQTLGKAVIIHCRDAHQDCIQLLRERGTSHRGVIHCFSGSVQDAQAYLELGFVLSFAGPVTYPNAAPLREAARTVPLDRMVVETDAPYLAPQVRRGKRNEPGYVRFTAEFIAQEKGVSFEELASQTTANACALFRI